MANTDPLELVLADNDLTSLISILPAKGVNLYLELNEPGSLSFDVPSGSAASALLESGQFSRVKYRGSLRGGGFVENINENIANQSEGGDLWKSVSGRGALALLDDAIVWDDGTTSSKRTFTAMTRAAILIQLIGEAQTRGGLSALVWDFSATVDTLSVADASGAGTVKVAFNAPFL